MILPELLVCAIASSIAIRILTLSFVRPVSIAAVFVLLIGMTCCPGNLMSKFPLNIILLMVFSLFQGVALGVIAASFACDARAYDPAKDLVVCINNPDAPAVNGRMSVLLAMAITIGVVLVLTIFACQTKYDFTGAGPYLMAALLIFIVFFAIAGIWLRFDKVYNLVYACIGESVPLPSPARFKRFESPLCLAPQADPAPDAPTSPPLHQASWSSRP